MFGRFCPSKVLLSLLLCLQQASSSIYRPDWLLGTNFGVAGTNASFDYVIVGGGTAGLTLATRLAQNGTFSVAVVEAGGFYELENGNVSQIPALAHSGTQTNTVEGVNPLIDWRFVTTPQPGAGGRSLHYARGKCLGGSSARNVAQYNRPTIGTMKKWADQVGDDSYLWENVLPFYKKSVHFTPPNKKTIPANATIRYDASAWSSDGGPLHVSYPNYIYAFGSYLKQAFTESTIPQNPAGFASGNLLGWQYQIVTEDPRDETRSSSQTSYLTLALQETRLVVYTHALAQKILFDESKTATGVMVEAAGVPFYLNATKEVIVSCGAFQSPQLLMVSGIGPAETLQRHKIPVLANRPGVGQNMWDDIIYGPTHVINLESSGIINNPEYAGEIFQEYLVNKTGPLTNVATDLEAWAKVSNQPWAHISASSAATLASEFPPDWPEVEWVASSNYFGAAPDDRNYGTIIVGLIALLSRGNVTISSSSMSDAPVINPNWLTNPIDQQIAVAAFKRARTFFTADAMKPIIIGDEVVPGKNVTTDAEILDFIMSSFAPLYHAACSNSMGKASDPMAVVDSRARVFGVQNLRVVDVSALPLLVPGQPQATVYMLAEKIAQDILDGQMPSTYTRR